MLSILLFSVVLVLIQLGGAYLRYLPFRPYLREAIRHRLWRWLLGWGFASIFIISLLLHMSEFHVGVFKAIFFFAPYPYFLISVYHIRQPIAVHVFVLGMQFLWVLAIHTVAAIGEGFWLADRSDIEVLVIHPIVYFGLFLLAFPFARRLFLDLLPSPYLFSSEKKNLSIAILPLAIFIGLSVPIADTATLHSLKIQLSRISIPLFFFFVYRGMSIATKKVDEMRQEEHTLHLMKDQLKALEEYDDVLRSNQAEAVKFAQEIRKDYKILGEALESGDISRAMKLIESREKQLETTKIQAFSPHPIVNAALSVYMDRAKALGIPVDCRVSLPVKLGVEEHDFSILLSNLLENAINASEHEPEDSRAISIRVRHRGIACVMEIANRSGARISFDEDGLPVTRQRGHGLGMASLSAFMEKYGAYADFTQEDGWLRFTMYWEV